MAAELISNTFFVDSSALLLGGVHDSTGGVHDSTGGVHDSTGGVQDSTGGVQDSTGGVQDSTARHTFETLPSSGIK